MPTLIPFPWPLADEVHIHCLALDTANVWHASPDELRRAESLFDPLKKKRFLASRTLLREILGRYLGLQPDELHFAEGKHGKPCLSGSDRLHFNLSHSGGLLLLAIAADRDVGIDLEQLRTDIPFLDMARLAFSPREQNELFDLPEYLQRRAFYRCWTRKEAYLKASGMGFSLPSNSFDVSLLPDTPVSMIAPGEPCRWSLLEITVPEGYCAALAVSGSAPHIRYIDCHH